MAGRRPSVWGGVLGISAVSQPCPRGSRCSPLTVPDPGSSLGGKMWWQSPRAEVLGGTSPRAGLSGFYLPCWLAQLMSSWPQPPEPQLTAVGAEKPRGHPLPWLPELGWGS